MALMLALTGESLAVARGMPTAAGQIVLCSGQGIVIVDVDENGQPVERGHICPDAASFVIAAVAQLPAVALRPMGQAQKMVADAVVRPASRGEIDPVARGPPGWV
ncbi:hypothetical protein U5922_011070 [Aquicoccus sp. G2-2]|uniref:hypothetical protein n=1 Tax=Aquicoccus sp. G2-2 TaxID=3092120 RepID=UPI002ADFB603|nr:hypothetical protein [Aquicoccus sp. G2-2]MEA1113978.1 hypothetical protein [Aquicoccus sp. G2-2]